MSQEWLHEMSDETANNVINLLHTVRETIEMHDYPHSDHVERFDKFLAHEHSLAVQLAEQILEWLLREGIELPDQSAAEALEFLQKNVPKKYLMVRDPSKPSQL